MGIFGGIKKPSMFGQVPMPPGYMGGSGIGDGMIERQQMEMQPGMGMPQMEPEKPKFFGEGGVGRAIAGNIGDFLLQNAGMNPMYNPEMQHQRAMQQRTQQAEQERMQRREDMQWEWQNKPREQRVNDTEQDWNYYKGVLTPAEFETWKQNKINPPRWVGDEYGGGQYVSPSPAPAPVMDISKGLPPGFKIKGGAASNGGNGFR